jgi:DNA-directed RNA polymerase specialized sigma24 family protein
VTKDKAATPAEFSAFIEWLDAGVPSGGRSYIEMHARLVSYFARKGCTVPNELADDTLTRVARRLREEGAIAAAAPAQYCYIVARFVLLEHLRGAERKHLELMSNAGDRMPPVDADQERLLACLDDCLGRLAQNDRALILSYYAGEGPERIAGRRALAVRFGLSPNALMIRASRVRERLRACVAGCRKDG